MAKVKWYKGVILGLLIAIGGWAMFQMVLFGVSKFFEKLGIISPFWQYFAIVMSVIVILVIGWHNNLKEAIKRLVR